MSRQHAFFSLVNAIERVTGPKHSLWDIPEFIALGAAAVAVAIFVVRAEDCTLFLFHVGTVRGSEYPMTVFSGKSSRTYGFLEPWVQEALWSMEEEVIFTS